MKVVTDPQKIKEVLERSIASILPSEDALLARMREGKRLRFYTGADPTGPELHIGNATNFIFLEKIRALGHEVIVLFGDFTAMIGDPTGKDATRKRLNPKEVKENIKTWKNQAGKVLDFETKKNPAKVMLNSTWHKKLRFEDVVELASHFTVQQMLERDMFQRRLESKKPIYLHEFFYPLMQGYDSVAMDVDVEVGGTDQTFNMMVGRTLQKIYNNKEKFVITTALLEDPKTGEKLMNKSEGKYIALNDSPEEMFGKTMALPDSVIVNVFRDSTYASRETIDVVKKKLEEGANPRDHKMHLAYEVVRTYYDEKAAQNARENFSKTFQKGGTPHTIQEVAVERQSNLCDILLRAGIVKSKTEFRRLLEAGAISIPKTKETIRDANYKMEESAEFRVGKKRFIRLFVR